MRRAVFIILVAGFALAQWVLPTQGRTSVSTSAGVIRGARCEKPASSAIRTDIAAKAELGSFCCDRRQRDW